MKMLKTLALGVVAATMILAVPLDAFAQRGGGRGGGWGGGGRGGSGFSIGPGGFSIGTGSGRINVGSGGIGYGTGGYGRGYGYGYGGYGRGYGYGYPGYYGRGYGGYGYGNGYYGNNGYYNDGYYSGGSYYSQPSYSQPVVVAKPDYNGPGVTVRNNSDEVLSFTLDGSRQMQIEPGQSHTLSSKPEFVIAFDRGGSHGEARYTIHEGEYAFTPTSNGWELFRQKDGGLANRNPDVNVRTAERPQLEDRDLRPMDRDNLSPIPDENLTPQDDDAALPPPLPE
jgi:hypothetical protein